MISISKTEFAIHSNWQPKKPRSTLKIVLRRQWKIVFINVKKLISEGSISEGRMVCLLETMIAHAEHLWVAEAPCDSIDGYAHGTLRQNVFLSLFTI